ncbi:MAG: TetR/AcrR family transcriptional regulator [Pseudomonadota bacterium]|nr:TetR/AcrR family transcriptional regulator [Pseudomonadota bacterium]
MEENENTRDDTREKLLAAALQQFAARGFHGASIAQIAGELDLTKQALLYYFKRKEDLYSEVLRRIATRMRNSMKRALVDGRSPEQQFEDVILGLYASARENPDDPRVLLREALENKQSDAPEESWHIRGFLDEVVALLDRVPGFAEMEPAQKFAVVYQLLSAIQFFAATAPALTRFYGEEQFAKIDQSYPDELRNQVHRMIASANKG